MHDADCGYICGEKKKGRNLRHRKKKESEQNGKRDSKRLAVFRRGKGFRETGTRYSLTISQKKVFGRPKKERMKMLRTERKGEKKKTGPIVDKKAGQPRAIFLKGKTFTIGMKDRGNSENRVKNPNIASPRLELKVFEK